MPQAHGRTSRRRAPAQQPQQQPRRVTLHDLAKRGLVLVGHQAEKDDVAEDTVAL
jgi:hypothetical protein